MSRQPVSTPASPRAADVFGIKDARDLPWDLAKSIRECRPAAPKWGRLVEQMLRRRCDPG